MVIKKETEKSLTCMDDLLKWFSNWALQILGNRGKPWSYFRGSFEAGTTGGQKRETKQVKFWIS